MSVAKFKLFFLTVLLIFLFPHQGYPQEDRNLYTQGVKAAQRGELEFAFINFHLLLNNFPESKYRRECLFGTGEYYFSIADYRDAARVFSQFINDYPKSEAKPFAIAYLLNIAKKEGEEDLVEELKKELIGLEQLSLLFRDFKELQYVSALCKNYKALNFIDKIEIYIDDELFAEASF